MATITATITIDFNANYAGTHRVCYRIQGSGDPYDCTTSVSCVGGGTLCQAVITADVNSTSCDGTVTFEGYIQSACEDILSTSGRLLWTADFVPTVLCQRYEVLCARTPISNTSIDNGGALYTLGDTINIVRNGSDPETLDGTITIATVDGGGAITGLTVSVGGLYSIPPTLTVTSGTGAGALLSVIMAGCDIYTNVGTDCIGGDQVDIADQAMSLGEIFGTCIEIVGAATPAQYDFTATGCCVSVDSANTVCTDVHLENASGGPVNVHVTLCNGDDAVIAVADATTEAVCLIADGWIDPQVVGFTITDQTTPCTGV